MLLLLAQLSGCETASFYSQAATGHWKILSARQPIGDLVQQDNIDEALKVKLKLILELREYAQQELQLPVGDNYQDYTDIERPFVVWNLFAAPELEIAPLSWCFPIAGCVNYKGYFDEEVAREQARQLAAEGYDVYVGGIKAYSTLGWFDDVVLSTFIKRDDSKLAALLFHELAHQQLYLKDDTTFNESFARAVEIEGVQRWLTENDRAEEFLVYQSGQRRHDAWVALLARYRERLTVLYQSEKSDDEKREGKAQLLSELLNEYVVYKEKWNYTGYDRWMNDSLNNAKLATVADYNDWVSSFRQLFREEKGSWETFFQRSEQLAELNKDDRRRELLKLRNKYLSSDSRMVAL